MTVGSFTFRAAVLAAGLIAANASAAQDLGALGSDGLLVLPLDISQMSGDVAIEIDGIDVTDFASIVDGQLVVSPGAGLGGGSHEVIVYGFAGDSVSVLASYTYQDAGAGGGTVSVTATHEVGTRVVNGDGSTDASSVGTIEAENGDTTVTARVDYRATTIDSDKINGNTIDIAEYFIELRRPGRAIDLIGRIGHHQISFDPVLVDALTRRGVSVEASTTDERFRLSLFGMRSSDALGADNILGLDEDDDRMFGASLAWQPFVTTDLTFSLQAYEGKGDPFGSTLVGTGSGASFGFDGSSVDGRFRYGATFGQSTWDADGAGLFFAEEDGDALVSYLSYDVLGYDGGDQLLTVGLDYSKVDDAFFSLANANIVSGVETLSFWADYATGPLSLYGVLSTQRDVIPAGDRYQTDFLELDGTYALAGQGILSDATLDFGGSLAKNRRIETLFPATTPDTSRDTTFYVGVSSFSDLNSWSIRYDISDFNGLSGFAFDQRDQIVTLNYDRTLRENTQFRSGWTSTFSDDGFDTYSTHELTLGLDHSFRNSDWSITSDAAFLATDLPGAEDGSQIGASLSWAFNPAAELVLGGAYRDGAYAFESGDGHDAVFSVLLRANTNFLR